VAQGALGRAAGREEEEAPAEGRSAAYSAAARAARATARGTGSRRAGQARPAAPKAPGRDLLEFFKEWRWRTAQRAAVPAYIVLSDAALEDLCRKQPSNLRELLRVTGFGERKAELYGSEIFAAFEAYRNGPAPPAQRAPRGVAGFARRRDRAPVGGGKSFEEIARIRGRQFQTVINMVADLVEKGRLEYRLEWVGEANHARLKKWCAGSARNG